MSYGIGLDIGIASVGYAVLDLDYDEKPWGIIRLGSRIFDRAEVPKTGASLAQPRREARSARRRLRRHRHRLERIRNLFVVSHLLTQNELDHLYDGQLTDIYELRVKALDERVSNAELARILLHLATRRGFKSNRKAELADKEAGALKTAISENEKSMAENHYRSVGEMFLKDPRFKEHKRNKGGTYTTTVARSMVADEAALILDTQQKLGNSVITKAFKDSYLTIMLSQRAFDEGPGGKSPYGGNMIEKMVGICTFEDGSNGEPPEKRAAKACYSFEYFNLLQKINHIRLISDNDTVSLTDNQRTKLIELAKKVEKLNYDRIRKELNISKEYSFNMVRYETVSKKSTPDEERQADEKKEKFEYLPFYHQIRKALDNVKKNRIQDYTVDMLDQVGWYLTIYKGDDKRREALSGAGIPAKDIEELLTITGMRKFGHLSLKALKKINPYLEKGLNYNDACDAAGYKFTGNVGGKTKLLPANAPELEDITNPVARRSISQTIKVINAIIREQGESPLYINVELARELSKDYQERQKIEKENEQNQSRNDKAMEQIRENFGIAKPSGQDLVKYKLWQEQDGISPYSQKPIEYERLFEPGYVEVDHIIPYSISFDDTYKNKVLVFSSENRDKGNRVPLAYLMDKKGAQAADHFKVWVNANIRDYRKRQKLLKEKITNDDISGFKERNLTDTKYISRFMYNYIADHLQFAPSQTGKKRRVTAVNGMVTSYLRKRWGINKIRGNGDKHHAVDAVVIAAATPALIREISGYAAYRETGRFKHKYAYEQGENGGYLVHKGTGEIKDEFPYPWEGFRTELIARSSDRPTMGLEKLPYYVNKDLSEIKPIFVSRMPRRKVTGPAHKETITGARHIEDGFTLSKVALTDLKMEDGEIKDYYNPSSDRILYEALKDRLNQYNGDAKAAFAEPFYKPKADGSRGPLVKKVKIMNKTTMPVLVQQKTGAAVNDTMVRVDVFYVKGEGYYLVPIYVADTVKPQLPNLAIVAHKSMNEWKVMDDKNFQFSLYPGDLIHFVSKQPKTFTRVNDDSSLNKTYDTTNEFAYYVKTGIATATITIITHDHSYVLNSFGVKKIPLIEKYEVDVLGNYHKVKREKRRPIIFKK
jgi:CRISPR-associated endonuclease Csn1